MAGSVVSINVSDGGVPKLPIPSAAVSTGGVAGDRQSEPAIHGGAERALCLFSQEVIDGWRAEGHTIEAGSAGENLTIAGLDWSLMDEGARVRVGADLVAELTWAAAPCAKQRPWFSDGDFSRLSPVANPGSSRWYARVLAPGTVSVGDDVVVEPAVEGAR